MQFVESLGELLEEFKWDAAEFESTMLTLECLKSYWGSEELRQRYPEAVFKKTRLTLCQYLQQYAQELCWTATRLTSRAEAGPW